MNRDVVDRWCERGILGLVLGIMVFGPLATGAVRMLEFLTIQVMTLGVMILWGVRLWVRPKSQILWTPLCWAILAFVVYAIGRYLTADIEYVARQELIRILVYAFLFYAVINNLYRQEATQIICLTMIGLAALLSCYAIYQYVTGDDRVWYFIKPEMYKGRGGGTYICPNNFAGFLDLLLPLALSYVLVARGAALTRIFIGYAALVMVAGLGASVSRGGWVACGAGLTVLFCILAMHKNYRLPAVVLLVVLLGGAAAFYSKTQPLKKRFVMPVNSDALVLSDATVRVDLWEAAIHMWEDHPWFGVGPGHYDYQFHSYRPPTMQSRPERAHNEYLNTLADWGLVGEVLVLGALGILGWGVTKTWKHVRRSEFELGTRFSNKFGFVLGVSCGMIALLVHSVVDFNLQIPANAILATCLMALLSSHLRFATDRYWVTVNPALRLTVSVVLLAGLGYLGWQAERRGHEYYWLDRAESARIDSPEQAALLEKAFAAEPKNFETSYRIGECYRTQAFEGGDYYEDLARKAMEWYAIGWKINPLDSYNYLRYGMCLDWNDRHEEAEPYFNKADEFDRNSYYTTANIAWHYVQSRNFAAARVWIDRSRLLKFQDNDIANSYQGLVEQKLLDIASVTNSLKIQ